MIWWDLPAGGIIGFAMTIFLILFSAAVVVGLVLVIRAVSGGGGTSSALRILEERYARGEIDRDEFIRRRDDLRG